MHTRTHTQAHTQEQLEILIHLQSPGPMSRVSCQCLWWACYDDDDDDVDEDSPHRIQSPALSPARHLSWVAVFFFSKPHRLTCVCSAVERRWKRRVRAAPPSSDRLCHRVCSVVFLSPPSTHLWLHRNPCMTKINKVIVSYFKVCCIVVTKHMALQRRWNTTITCFYGGGKKEKSLTQPLWLNGCGCNCLFYYSSKEAMYV